MGSMKESQSDTTSRPSISASQSSLMLIPDKQDVFDFLKKEEKHSISSFFSENGLGQDIIKVTDAEPDISLEVFYELYNTLWPHIEEQSDVSLRDAWKNFIGGSLSKGVLCPPERLIGKKKLKDIKKLLAEDQGEHEIFKDLDGVIKSILDLKQKIADFPDQLLQKEEILESLDLVKGFYQGYRNKVKELVETIIEKEQMNILYSSESDALEDLLEPKAVMTSEVFTGHWAYRIPRNKAQKILSVDAHGRPMRNDLNESSNHRVAALPERSEAPEPLVYFKANGHPALQPEKEFMVYSLYRHLKIPIPETALLILTEVFEGKSDHFYAVQASEAVSGRSVLEALKNPETTFEEENFVPQVIGALLTNPFDGSFKNFKYSPMYKTLISIDNDVVFGPELIGENVNIRSILYLLPFMDKPIPASIKTYFTTLDPDLIVFMWLKELERKNREYELLMDRLSYQHARSQYQALSSQDDIPSLAACIQERMRVDSKLFGEDDQPFTPQIAVSKNLLNSVTAKLNRIEQILSEKRSISPQILLNEVSLLIGKYYGRLRQKFPDPEKAEEALWGNWNEDGINYCCILSLLNPEELRTRNTNLLENGRKECKPEEFFKECRKTLNFENNQTPLDSLIRRHSERKMKDLLDLHELLKELQFLTREKMTDSKFFRIVVDFWYDLSKIIIEKTEIVQEIRDLIASIEHVEMQWLLTLEKYFQRNLESPVVVQGAFMKRRSFYLTESEKKYIFDQQGDIRKNPSLTGRSKVTCFPEKNPEFYLKQYPEWPCYEFARRLLMRLLGISDLPHQDLMIIDSKYPVLLTQKVDGDPVFRVWQNPEAFKNLDSFQTGLLIIAAMLINPEDGKEDNFILSPDGRNLTPIDNDHCFLPSTFQKGGNFWNAFTVNTALQTKTILFCLDEMKKPIPLEVKQQILSINFDSVLVSWVKELIKVEDRYNYFVNQAQRDAFLKNNTVLRSPFYEQFIQHLYWKVNKIQDLLRSTTEQTPFSLLKAVEPFAAICYQNSFEHGNTLESRFKAATNSLYIDANGSRISIINTQSMMNKIHVSKEDLADDMIYSQMGPSNALELLDQLVKERKKKIKMEKDLFCDLDDQNEGKRWTLFGDPLLEANLKDFFTNPKESLVLKGSKLITSKKFATLFALNPDQGTKIKFLSLPNSPLLDSGTVRTLVEGCPNLEYLDISGCAKLEEIVTAKGEWPLLARIEAKECLVLEKFVSYSPVRALRLGTSWKIEISIEEFHLDVLDVFFEKRQFDFHFKKGQGFGIKSINKPMQNFELTPYFGDLFGFYVQDIKIKLGQYSFSSEEDFRSLISFFEVRDDDKDTQKIKEVTELFLTKIKNLILSGDFPDKMSYLEGLKALREEKPTFIESVLALGKWSQLEELNLNSARITKKAIHEFLFKGDWPNLKYLNLSKSGVDDQELSIISYQRPPLLETLDVSETSVTTKGLIHMLLHANWPNLKEIIFASSGTVHQDQVNSFLPEKSILFEKIDLSSLELAKFELEGIFRLPRWPQLKHLNISNNAIFDTGLSMFSQGEWPLLETLDVSNTSVSTKGVIHMLLHANWLNLKEIIFAPSDLINQDQVNSFLPTKSVFLEKIDLSNLGLTKFELEEIPGKVRWPQLKHLNLSNNLILDEGLAILSQGEWPLLETIDLSSTKTTTKGVIHLLTHANWPNLKEIVFVSSDSIDQTQIKNLLPANWSSLERLDLSETKVTLKGFEKIVKRFRLKSLNISENKICEEALETLLLGEWPLLEEFQMQNTKTASQGIQKMIKQSKWPQLKHLNIAFNEISENGFLALSQKEWPLLEKLQIQNTGLGLKGVNAIIKQSQWPNLVHLNVSFNPISDKGIIRLTKGNWPLLEELSANDIKMSIKGIEAIMNEANWPKLKRLYISKNEIGTEGFLVLTQGKWPLLEELDVSYAKISENANQANWPQLKKLNISNNVICKEGCSKLLSLGKWPLLENLNLQNTGMTLRDIETIVNDCQWPRLKHINLSENSIFNEGLLILSQGNWPLLETLDLTLTKTTPNGLMRFLLRVNWPNLKSLSFKFSGLIDQNRINNLLPVNWPSLKKLDLREIEISPIEISTLINIHRWPQLKSLDLSNNEICKEEFQRVPFEKWPSLKELRLINTNLTVEHLEILVKKFKLSKLQKLSLSSNKIFDEGLEILAYGKWPRLEHLSLNVIDATEEGIEYLMKNSEWPNLKSLAFVGNYVFDEEQMTLKINNWLSEKKIQTETLQNLRKMNEIFSF